MGITFGEMMNKDDRSKIKELKNKIYDVLPEGTNLLFAIIAMAEIITDFTKLSHNVLTYDNILDVEEK